MENKRDMAGRTRALFPYLYRQGAAASVWLVACGLLLGVLLSPEIIKHLGRLRSASVEAGDGEDSIAWEVSFYCTRAVHAAAVSLAVQNKIGWKKHIYPHASENSQLLYL